MPLRLCPMADSYSYYITSEEVTFDDGSTETVYTWHYFEGLPSSEISATQLQAITDAAASPIVVSSDLADLTFLNTAVLVLIVAVFACFGVLCVHELIDRLKVR